MFQMQDTDSNEGLSGEEFAAALEAWGGGCASRHVSSYCIGATRHCCCLRGAIYESCGCHGQVNTCGGGHHSASANYHRGPYSSGGSYHASGPYGTSGGGFHRGPYGAGGYRYHTLAETAEIEEPSADASALAEAEPDLDEDGEVEHAKAASLVEDGDEVSEDVDRDGWVSGSSYHHRGPYGGGGGGYHYNTPHGSGGGTYHHGPAGVTSSSYHAHHGVYGAGGGSYHYHTPAGSGGGGVYHGPAGGGGSYHYHNGYR